MKTIKIGNEEVSLDTSLLKFTESTINKFLELYAEKYDYFLTKHAKAQYIHARSEDRYDALYAERFKTFKEEGGSDKLCESKTICDADVQSALATMRLAKHNVNILWGFLRAMDRAHEDAMQTCYNLRKELDKLYPYRRNSNNEESS